MRHAGAILPKGLLVYLAAIGLLIAGCGISFCRNIQPMFLGRCTACHGYEPGRFDPNNYAGIRGVVIPGDPAASTFVQMMEEGHHRPGLNERELLRVIEWIIQGAPDN